MQREDFLSIWISLKTYQLRGIPTTLETKINHKINIHTNIFQKNHKKEFGPRLTEKRNSIGPQRVNDKIKLLESFKFYYEKTILMRESYDKLLNVLIDGVQEDP